MKKLAVIFLFVLMFGATLIAPNFVYAQENQSVYVVTANYASVFKNADITSNKLGQVNHNEEVYIEMENDLPKEYMSDDFVFYKITYNQLDGYVLADLLTPKNNVITAIPSFNAQTNSACKVYFKQDNEMVESDISLDKGERIFLYEGFNGKEEYNAISFVYENQVLYGYLKSENIAPDGINPIIITCIIIIIALLGIIFAWLFMKNKKVKIKKHKTK